MSKGLKVVLGLVVSVIIGLGGLYYIVSSNLDPKALGSRASQIFKAKTGLDLIIEGGVGLEFFPIIKLRVDKAYVNNPAGFESGPMFGVEQVKIEVELGPLLKKELRAGEVEVRGLTLAAQINQAGELNFDALRKAAPSGAQSAAQPGAGPEELNLELAGLKITQAKASFSDKRSQQAFQAANIEAKLGKVKLGEPVQFEFSCDLSAAQPQFSGRVSNKGSFKFDAASGALGIEGLTGALTAQAKDAGLSSAETQFSLASLNTTPQGALTLSGVKSTFKIGGPLPGAVEASLELAGMNLTPPNLIKIDSLKFSALLKGLTAAKRDESLEFSVKSLDLANEELKFDSPKLKLLEQDFPLKLAIKNPLGEPVISGGVDLNLNPASLLAKLGEHLEFPDKKALNKLSGQVEFSLNKQEAKFDLRNFKLDEMQLSGKFNLSELSAKPKLNFGLKIDSLDVDRYTPAPAPAGKPGQAGQKEADKGLPPAPLALSGSLEIGTIKAQGLKISDFAANIAADEHSYLINPLRFKLYQGQAKGSVKVKPGAKPQTDLEFEGSGIAVEALLKDLKGQAQLSGTASFNSHLSASGLSPQEATSTLAGKLGFALKNGQLNQASISHKVVNAAEGALGAKSGQKTQGGEGIKYDQISANFAIKSGVASSSDLLAQTKPGRFDGSGSLNLPAKTMDINGKFALLNAATVPVRVTGSFEDPQVSVDVAGIAKDAVIQGVGKIGDAVKSGGKPLESVGKGVLEGIGGALPFKKK